MLSGTLKERLAQYKTLKAEEKRNTELAGTSSATPEDTTKDATPEDTTKDATADAPEDVPPPESTSPNETVSPAWAQKAKETGPDVASASPADSLTKDSERGSDVDISSSHVEEVVEEEIVENDSEQIEVDSEEDEIEIEVEVEESSTGANDDVSSEAVSVKRSQQRNSKISQGASEDDQDVFKALDEAERAENEYSSPRGDVPARTGPDTTESKAKGDSKEVSNKKEGKSRSKCIVFTLVFLLCAVVVAVVLPFFLDYPSRSGSKTTESSTQEPPESSQDVSTPKPTRSPLTNSPTDPPSDAPTTLQWGQFLNAFLIPNSGEEVFQNKDSPQYRAAQFVLDDPYTDMVTTTGRLNDRYASVTFYFATEGENWKSCYFGDTNCASGQWLEGDVCGWHAVLCDDEGRVTAFLFADAEGNGLVGTLPREIKLLSAMTDLVIVNNTIKGTLPDEFGQTAESMRSLLLPDNDLTGKIPDNYLSSSPLEFVHLGSNTLSGPVPTKIGGTAHLQQLDLSGNSMTGTIPGEIGGYEVLEALSLANNILVGSIPEEMYGLSNLKFLHVNGNDWSGTISSLVGDLSSLKELRVGGSELTGYIPDELYTLSDLVELDISQAQFNGKLSFAFLKLKNLEKLIVNGNNLTGTVPNSFGRLSSLSDLNLQENEFTGTIPEELCALFDENLEVLTADCEKVTCECCSACF